MRPVWIIFSVVFCLLFILSHPYGPSRAQTLSASTGETLTRGRSGPAYSFPVLQEILPQTEVILLGQNPAGDWLLVQASAQTNPLWIPLAALSTPPDENLFILNSEPPPPLRADNCLSLVGDSVAYGTTVYEVPGQGFAILQTSPLSLILTEALHQRGLGHIEVRDRSASAAFLGDEGKNPYREMPEFSALLADSCRFILIMPWVNDMSLDRPNPVTAHIADLIRLVEELNSLNPAGHILLLGFYDGQPSSFARQHAPGYTAENIALFNAAWVASCADKTDGLGQFAKLTCLPTNELFSELDNAHVALGINQADLLAILSEPIPGDVAPFFEVYWRDNPQGLVYGDGVHLSEGGKALLSQMIIEALLALEPDL